MPYQLKQKKITVCGEKLTVFQASNDMDVERAIMIAEAEATHPAVTAEDTKARYMVYMSTLLYPSLAACTKGNVPTLEDFLYHIPTAETEAWVVAAKELNPQWFTFVTATETKEDDEKKEL